MSLRIRRVGAGDLVDSLPELEPLTGDSFGEDRPNVYIGALGFEERALGAVARLGEVGVMADGGRAVIVLHRTNRPENERNRSALMQAVRRLGDNPREVADDERSLRMAVEEAISLADRGRRPRIVVDLSAMSSRQIAVVLSIVLEQRDVALTLVYAEAEDYAPSRDEFERDREVWAQGGGVDLGVLDVCVADAHVGYRVDHLPDALCLLAGLSRDRASAVISSVFPSLVPRRQGVIRWLLGQPARLEFDWRVDAAAELHSVDRESEAVSLVSTFDYRDSFSKLHQFSEEVGLTHLVTVAALGSKMETVGAVLYATARPEIRLITARPERYSATSYSRGVREVWSLNFGPVESLLETLGTLGALELVE